MFGSKPARSWRGRLKNLLGRDTIEVFPEDELRAMLFEADLSADIVGRLLEARRKAKARGREEVLELLASEVVRVFSSGFLEPGPLPDPGAILLLGVNGSGKTTVAGKLAKRYRDRGKRVFLAAADTFRAGAIDQIRLWGERVGAEVVAQKSGADPGAVVFDAWQRVVAEGGVLITDTAGRLHTKKPLVEELKKIVRVLGKDGKGAPHESYLVLDGTTGQNALAQSREFVQAAPLTGLIVTKLDGTAKGGASLSAAVELSLPIRYLGVGENEDQLLPFNAVQFAHEFFQG